MRHPFTVYDATTGKVLATGMAPAPFLSPDPGREILWYATATDEQYVDPATGQLADKGTALAVTAYAVTVGGSLTLNLPVPMDVFFEGDQIGTMSAGGDSITFPNAGSFDLDLVDTETGLWRSQRITVVVT